MDFSSSNQVLWNTVLQFGMLACIALLANVLRLKVPFVRKSLMPTAVLAGFIALLMRIAGIVQVDTKLMEILIYHTIAIGFISMSLQIPGKSERPANGDFIAAKSGALIISTYLIQGMIGLVISAGLAYTLMPGFFKAAGILLPMGYGQGAGQANNVGLIYQSLGFEGGQSFGLSIAAMGYLVACVVGIAYLNVLKIRGKLPAGSDGVHSGKLVLEDFESKKEPPAAESIDRLSMQLALISVIYLFTYLITSGSIALLQSVAPGLAKILSPLLWGFNFIIGSLIAQAFRKGLKALTKAGLMTCQYTNNYLLSRISGFAFDLMVIAGIATIRIEDLSGLWLPFTLMSVTGAVITLWFLQWICKGLYAEYYYEGLLSMYGMLTGNISSGVMLLRELDPSLKTPAANNLIAGSSFAIAIGAPMLIFIGLAPQSDFMLFLTMVLFVIYLVPLVLFILKFQRKNSTD